MTNREAVLSATAEADRLGREVFLERYGFRPAREYLLVVGGKDYDSKAIAGVAYGYEHPGHGPLRSAEFSGGEGQAARWLRDLGFEVRSGASNAALEVFGRHHAVWVEITRADHGHGGPGWEFGTCLWSPATDRRGGDRYAIMRDPAPGDLVIHLLHDTWESSDRETRVAGRSRVARSARRTKTEPPSAGPWRGHTSYYRIDVRGFLPFSSGVSVNRIFELYGEDIREEILEDRPRHYPFATYGSGLRTAEGMYLARCTSKLFALLRTTLEIQPLGERALSVGEGLEEEFAEARRLARERYYFARNPNLVKAAKAHYGYVCQVCGFDFARRYGPLGQSYIECHHLNPLSDRAGDALVTRLEDVRVVCSNCHRMIHKRRPPLGLEELREIMVAEGN